MSGPIEIVLPSRLVGFTVACLLGLPTPCGLLVTQGAVPQTQPADLLPLTGGPTIACAPTEDVILTLPNGPAGYEMIIEVRVPEIEVQRRTENGQQFHAIGLQGYGLTSQPGKPQMPVKGYWLAVPEGAHVEVEVLKSEAVSRSGYTVYPVPRPVVREEESGALRTAEEFCIDKAAYSSSEYYPQDLTEIGSYGYLRDLRVAQLRVFPVQYRAATGDLLMHNRIRLKVRFVGGSYGSPAIRHEKPVGRSDPFEDIYRSVVLNYDPALPTTQTPEKVQMIPLRDLRYLMNDPYKVSIEEDGIYEIRYEDLVSAGADFSGVDPATIKIFNRQREVPVFVWDELDGAFGAGDYVEFFGCANKSGYSRSNTYWLSWGGGPGLRMEQRDCSPGDSLPVPTTFAQRLHFEEDHRYYSNVFQGESKDHWFWEQLTAPCTSTYPMKLPGAYPSSSDAQLRIGLRGRTASPHHTEVFLNGHQVADLHWDEMVELDETRSFPHSCLLPGVNELMIRCPSSSMDQAFFNWFEVEYQRVFVADNGYLRFRDPTSDADQFEIAGFADNRVEAFQITDPGRVVRLVGYSVVTTGSDHTVIFESGQGQEEFLVVDTYGRKHPTSITRDEPSNLHFQAGGADYVIITHDDFYESIQPLRALRESEGLRVEVVRIGDIYDEFSDGNFDPQAIRDFLEYSYHNWQSPAPVYALLVGDASFDYMCNISSGNVNYVPTHLFVSQSDYVEVSSDDWFAYIVGEDLLPDILVGRLSAQTRTDIEAIVAKIVDYETNLGSGDWRERVLLVADDTDEGGDFESVCDEFAEDYIVPSGFEAARVYVSECRGGCTARIIDSLNLGCAVCMYVGHGSMDQWAGEGIFVSSDCAALYNSGKLPLIAAFTCLNGFFHHATDDYCLAEEFHRVGNRGAVSCLAHSGLDYTSTSRIIGGYLYDALLRGGNHVLGSAILQAKAGYLATSPYFWDQAMMLILFGDPAIEMGFPGRADLLAGSIDFSPKSPKAGRPDTLVATVYNAGREAASAFSVRFSRNHPDSTGSTIIAEADVPGLAAGDHVPVLAIWDSVPDPGTYCVVAQVDPDNRILESSEWNNVFWDSLFVRSPHDIDDEEPPQVSLIIEGKTVGGEFQDLDYVSSNPTIEAVATDAGTGIDIEEIHVTLNGEPIPDVVIRNEGVGADTVRLSCRPVPLPDGTHTLEVSVHDCASIPNDATASVTFVLVSELRISGTTIYPNPSQATVSFGYSLSQDAREVAIEIYSVAGRLITTLAGVSGSQNRNVVTWDGKDHGGGQVGTGVYFYRIMAKDRSESCSRTGRVTLVR